MISGPIGSSVPVNIVLSMNNSMTDLFNLPPDVGYAMSQTDFNLLDQTTGQNVGNQAAGITGGSCFRYAYCGMSIYVTGTPSFDGTLSYPTASHRTTFIR